MTSFRHDISGGNGNLIIISFQSPDFISGKQGWQVKKNGDVEFNSGTFRGIVTGGEFEGNNFIINSQGQFFYNGTPAIDNLIVSISGTATNDPFGTPVIQGIEVNGAGGFAQLETSTTHPALILVPANMVKESAFANVHVVGNNPGAVNESQTLVVTSGIINNNADATLQLISDASDGSTLAQASINVPVIMDQWHNMTLVNGWVNTAGFAVARYRKIASPPNSVEVIAALSGNAATANTFFTLPNGYIPNSQQGFSLGCTSAADTTNGRCDTLGNLQVANVVFPVAQTFFIHAVISLDA